jgi:hypothetical protein
MTFYEVIMVVLKDKPMVERLEQNFEWLLMWDKVYN